MTMNDRPHSFVTMARSQAWQGPEFDRLIPLQCRLPAALAYPLARWRGRFNARHDRDWVSLGLGHSHVAPLTRQAFASLLPPEAVEAAVAERYCTVAREEFECRQLARRGLDAFDVDCRDALARIAKRPKGKGVLLVTTHFETFMVAVASFASQGERIDGVISEVTADPRVHPSVRTHFRTKYEGLEALIHGGRLLAIEGHARHFYEVLKGGGIVVMLVDAPAPSPEHGVWVPWMGQVRSLAQGALRMAQRTDSLMGAFVSHHQGGRRHGVHMAPFLSLSDDEDQARAQFASVFAFLEAEMRPQIGRWWGAHLLPHYHVQAPAEAQPAAQEVAHA